MTLKQFIAKTIIAGGLGLTAVALGIGTVNADPPTMPPVPAPPAVPGVPDVPAVSDVAGVPDVPAAPGVPGVPSVPGAPQQQAEWISARLPAVRRDRGHPSAGGALVLRCAVA
jgi:hypothetical protein